VSKDIYWLCIFTVHPGQFEAFKAVVRPLVEMTRKEEGALAYEYNVSEDHSRIHIIEHYPARRGEENSGRLRGRLFGEVRRFYQIGCPYLGASKQPVRSQCCACERCRQLLLKLYFVIIWSEIM
jgi:hypothetical protein